MLELTYIVPVYNVEQFVPYCLESIAAQTIDSWECIVVDDGSTDGSGAICDEFAAKDSRFMVIHQENGGVARARNTGLDSAQGEFVAFVDGDDFLLPGAMAPMLDIARKYDLELLGFGSLNVDEQAKPQQYADTSGAIAITANEASPEVMTGLEYMARKNYQAEVWWYLVRRSLLTDEKMRFPEGRMLEDAAFNMKLLARTQRMAVTDRKAYCYRIRSSSIMHSKDKKHRENLIDDYLFAANDVARTLSEYAGQMAPQCLERCRSRRDSYILFGAIRALKMGKARNFLQQAKQQGLYPIKRLSKTDFPSPIYTLIHYLLRIIAI